jgi:hypothetical protein
MQSTYLRSSDRRRVRSVVSAVPTDVEHGQRNLPQVEIWDAQRGARLPSKSIILAQHVRVAPLTCGWVACGHIIWLRAPRRVLGPSHIEGIGVRGGKGQVGAVAACGVL